jgi:hypothetical protein
MGKNNVLAEGRKRAIHQQTLMKKKLQTDGQKALWREEARNRRAVLQSCLKADDMLSRFLYGVRQYP